MKQRHKSTIGIIGCGNMGQALIRGLTLKHKGVKVRIYDKDRVRLSKVKKAYRVACAASLDELVASCQTLIIAVKPQDIDEVLKVIKRNYRRQLIISIAAGISAAFIRKRVARRARLVRVMPNLAAKISMSVSALAGDKFATGADLNKAKRIFDSIGICLVFDQKYIDAFTAICGSGPGYLYYFMEALFVSARSLGFHSKVAKRMVIAMVLGAANLAGVSADEFKTLARRVASKGGTTEAAFKVFDKHRLKRIVVKAVKAAHRRSRVLGK